MKFYTTEEIAELLKTSPKQVIRWIQGIQVNEPLEAIKINREYRIQETDLLDFLKQHSVNQTNKTFKQIKIKRPRNIDSEKKIRRRKTQETLRQFGVIQ
jgi:excisionase family DNA binding protein